MEDSELCRALHNPYCTLEHIKKLLVNGADVNAKDRNTGSTPLHTAFMFPHEVPIIKLLLEKGADVSARNKIGITPLQCLLLNHRSCDLDEEHIINMLNILLDAGSDPSVQDGHGRTPLYIAICFHTDPIVKLLLEKGAVVHWKFLISTILFFTPLEPKTEIVLKYTLLEMRDVSMTALRRMFLKEFQWWDFIESCRDELCRMDSEVIGENLTLREVVCWKSWQRLEAVLQKPERKVLEWFDRCYVGRIVEIMHDKERYPIYKEIVSRNILNQVEQLGLMKKLKLLKVYAVFKEPGTSEKSVVLNYHCVCNVVQYLNNVELLYLVAAYSNSPASDTQSYACSSSSSVENSSLKRGPNDKAETSVKLKRVYK